MGPSRTTTFCTAEDSSAARTSDVTALPTIGGTGPRLLSTNVTLPPATCRVGDVGQFVAHHVASDQRFPHTGLQQSGFRLEPDRNIPIGAAIFVKVVDAVSIRSAAQSDLWTRAAYQPADSSAATIS